MESRIIKFNDFSSKEAFCELQRFFLGFDHGGKYLEPDNVNKSTAHVIKILEPLNNPEVIIYSQDENSEDQYYWWQFEEDFLIPKIELMANLAFEAFTSTIKAKGLYTPELMDGYAKEVKNNLSKRKGAISKSDYLKGEIKHSVIDQIDRLEDLIQGFLSNPFPELKQKIQFKWNRTDVIYLFHLLRKNKVIAEIGDADLGRLIDNAFEYYNQESGQYQKISNSKKHLNAYLNTEGRPEDPAIKRLRDIFQDDDFFNV